MIHSCTVRREVLQCGSPPERLRTLEHDTRTRTARLTRVLLVHLCLSAQVPRRLCFRVCGRVRALVCLGARVPLPVRCANNARALLCALTRALKCPPVFAVRASRNAANALRGAPAHSHSHCTLRQARICSPLYSRMHTCSVHVLVLVPRCFCVQYLFSARAVCTGLRDASSAHVVGR